MAIKTLYADRIEPQNGGSVYVEGQKKTTTLASASSVTPTGDALENEVFITTLAENISFVNPSGTGVKGNTLFVEIEAQTTVYTLTFGTAYAGYSYSLPANTVSGKGMLLGFILLGSGTWRLVTYLEEI